MREFSAAHSASLFVQILRPQFKELLYSGAAPIAESIGASRTISRDANDE
jgi:hypothetical protein